MRRSPRNPYSLSSPRSAADANGRTDFDLRAGSRTSVAKSPGYQVLAPRAPLRRAASENRQGGSVSVRLNAPIVGNSAADVSTGVAMTETPTRCPKCGEKPERIDRVREPTQTSVGDTFPEPQIVERATCRNGHKWFVRDETSETDPAS